MGLLVSMDSLYSCSEGSSQADEYEVLETTMLDYDEDSLQEGEMQEERDIQGDVVQLWHEGAVPGEGSHQSVYRVLHKAA
ncbi:hypothetical protein NDU88_003562 [Pleurodeles waltl]|uniref:Uncharacterized protein n=1 Tax=Pleurodeles waltl TaxID=8319 RepID=A0AAV7QD67_PLEWA|nr:hypothetical protein NDU88_003562 [Pleurodeles waltl]